MKTRLAAFASVLAFAVIPAFAQTAPALDPAAVQATRQMMAAMHAHDTMVQTLKVMEQAMPAQARASMVGALERNTTLTPQQKAEALDRFDKNLPAMMARTHATLDDPSLIDDLMAAMVPVYASTYTVDEIHQLTAFYESPVGQKLMAATPKVMGQVVEICRRVMQERVAKAMAGGAPGTNGQ